MDGLSGSDSDSDSSEAYLVGGVLGNRILNILIYNIFEESFNMCTICTQTRGGRHSYLYKKYMPLMAIFSRFNVHMGPGYRRAMAIHGHRNAPSPLFNVIFYPACAS